MSAEQNKALFRRAWETVWNQDNPVVAREFFAEGYCLRDSTGKLFYQHTIDELLTIVAMWKKAVPDITFSIEDIMAEGDKVVARAVYRGTHQGDFPWGPHPPYKPSGKPVEYGEILISRIADGKIAEDWFSMDFTDVWRQFGTLPA